MTYDATAQRRPRRWALWAAGAAALVALALLAWAMLSGRGDGGRRIAEERGATRGATLNAVDAVALAPALDPGPVGAPGGPGSAVVEGAPMPVAGAPAPAGQARRATRARRPARPRNDAPAARPSYRAIGPGGDEAPAAPAAPSGV